MKNGRTFYGDKEGHVHELKIEGHKGLLAMFRSEDKRLKKSDLTEDSILQKLLP